MGRLTTLKPRIAVLDTRTAQPAPKVADSFYNTTAWREARQLALVLGAFQCAHCRCKPKMLFVDHIVELSDGGAPLEQSNLEPLCGSCHTAKTAKARARRQAAKP